VLAKRKARWRKLRRRTLACVLGFVVLPWMGCEALARKAYVDVTRGMVRERLLESGRYAEARERYGALLGRYGWTTTGRFDVAPMIEELEARIPAEPESR
jgi:hypothetical protein